MRVLIKKQILVHVSKLPQAQQQLVINFASSLVRWSSRGVPGKGLSGASVGGKFGPGSGNRLCVS
jgi:hypothetical protein